MRTATATTIRSHLSDYLNQREPVIVTRNGRARAVLMPVADDDEAERLLMATNAEFTGLLAEAKRRVASEGGMPHDEFWRQVSSGTEAE